MASEYGDLDSDGILMGYKCDEIEDSQLHLKSGD